MESYMARANYNYDDKYYLSASVRSDGSSKVMINKWGTFWSVGGGWRFSAEPFMRAAKGWLDNAKLRASYGVIGNQNGIGNYTNHTWTYGVAVWNPSTNGQGTAQEYSISYGSLVNEELTWETVHTTDIGLDFDTFLMDHKKHCVNKCVFCFIDQMPPGMRKTSRTRRGIS